MSTFDVRSIQGAPFYDPDLHRRVPAPERMRDARQVCRFLEEAAQRLSSLKPRDRELLRAIADAESVSEAARRLAPESADGMRVRMQTRLRFFYELAEDLHFMMQSLAGNSPVFTRSPNDLRPPRIQPKPR